MWPHIPEASIWLEGKIKPERVSSCGLWAEVPPLDRAARGSALGQREPDGELAPQVRAPESEV